MAMFWKYFLIFMIYAFLGWSMEMVVCNIKSKKLVNRGFLVGPYCPIYGYGCLLIIILLKKYSDDPLALFIMASLICSILEYFTSYIMEKVFKARWWDYSKKKFNLNGRICLQNLVAFGILGLFIFYVVHPAVLKMLNLMSVSTMSVISQILFIIFIIDNIVSFKIISGFKNEAKTIRKDSTEEITKRVREKLLKKGWLYKRLVKSFDLKVSEKLLNNIHKSIKNSLTIENKEKR